MCFPRLHGVVGNGLRRDAWSARKSNPLLCGLASHRHRRDEASEDGSRTLGARVGCGGLSLRVHRRVYRPVHDEMAGSTPRPRRVRTHLGSRRIPRPRLPKDGRRRWTTGGAVPPPWRIRALPDSELRRAGRARTETDLGAGVDGSGAEDECRAGVLRPQLSTGVHGWERALSRRAFVDVLAENRRAKVAYERSLPRAAPRRRSRLQTVQGSARCAAPWTAESGVPAGDRGSLPSTTSRKARSCRQTSDPAVAGTPPRRHTGVGASTSRRSRPGGTSVWPVSSSLRAAVALVVAHTKD